MGVGRKQVSSWSLIKVFYNNDSAFKVSPLTQGEGIFSMLLNPLIFIDALHLPLNS